MTASFAGVAKHYGVSVAICPPRRGNRKGVVEKANDTAAQRWWRTLPDDITIEEAQASLDAVLCPRVGRRPPACRRRRTRHRRRPCRRRAADAPAGPVPGDAHASNASVTAQALVAFRGNRYSTPPELASEHRQRRLATRSPLIDIATISGIVVARHRSRRRGAGVVVRDHGHVTALDHAAMAAATSLPPHRRKQRIPPGPAALAAAAVITGTATRTAPTAPSSISAAYAKAANGRNTLT